MKDEVKRWCPVLESDYQGGEFATMDEEINGGYVTSLDYEDLNTRYETVKASANRRRV